MPEMPDFDVAGFVARLDRLGMMLSAVALADGRFRVNRWRTIAATEHAGDIDALWQGQIGNDQGRLDVLAAHLANPPSPGTEALVRPQPPDQQDGDGGRSRRRSRSAKKRRATGPPFSP